MRRENQWANDIASECNLLSAEDNRGIGRERRKRERVRGLEDLDECELKRVRRKYEGFLRDAGGRGNNFNHSRRSFDVLWGYLRIPLVRGFAIRSGNRTLFPLPAFATPAYVSRRCLVFLRRLKHGVVCACVQTILFRLRVVWGSRKYRGSASERNRGIGVSSIWLCLGAEANNGGSMSLCRRRPNAIVELSPCLWWPCKYLFTSSRWEQIILLNSALRLYAEPQI